MGLIQFNSDNYSTLQLIERTINHSFNKNVLAINYKWFESRNDLYDYSGAGQLIPNKMFYIKRLALYNSSGSAITYGIVNRSNQRMTQSLANNTLTGGNVFQELLLFGFYISVASGVSFSVYGIEITTD